MSRLGMSNIVRKATSCVLSLVMLVGTISPAFAAGTEWNSVIRPGVNAGTGTADYYVDLFTPLYQDGTSMLFFNPKFRINTGRNDENEINVGLGYRALISGGEWFVGGNVYFDTMESRYNNRYNQIGLGVEARSQWLDVILNGYIVVGDDINYINEMDMYVLQNTSMGVHKGAEQALSGVDAEIGVLIPGISDYMETRAYIGGYWWFSDISDDPIGVKGRIELCPVPLLTINGMVNYDDVFDDVWRAEAYLNIPFSFTSMVSGENPFAGIEDSLRWGKGPRTAAERMTDRVERDRYIVTVSGTEEAVSSVHKMIYVDNSNTTGIEDGTKAHPWNTIDEGIAQMQDGTDTLFHESDPAWLWIMVGDHPYDGEHTLHGGDLSTDSVDVVVWGEGCTPPGIVSHGMPVVDGGDYGFLFNGGTYGGDLTFRGMAVQNTGGDGLYAWNLDDVTIQCNVFRNNYNDGVDLHVLGSNVLVEDNEFIGNGNGNYGSGFKLYATNMFDGDDINIRLLNNESSENGWDGLQVQADTHYDGDINILAQGNICNNNYDDGIDIFSIDQDYMGDVNISVLDNEVVGNEGFYVYGFTNAGIYVNAVHHDEGNINVNILRNSLYLNEEYGIYLWGEHDGDMGNLLANINDNASNNNGDDNIYVNLENNAVYGGNVTMNVLRNEANRSDSGSGIFIGYADINDDDSTATGNVVVNVNDNNASFNYDDNIYIYPYITGSGNHDMTVNVLRNTATDSENGYGIYVYADTESSDTSNVKVLIDDNVADGNEESNIYFYAYNNADYGDIMVDVTDNQCSSSESYYGIYGNIWNYADGDTTLNIRRNVANDNYESNIYLTDIYAYGDGDLTVNIVDNEASGAHDDYGIEIEDLYQYGDGDLTLLVDGNIANGNEEDNFYFEYIYHEGDYGDVNITITDNEASSSEDGYGIYFYYIDADPDGEMNILVANNVANGNNYSNIEFEDIYVYGDMPVDIDIVGNQASDSEDDYGIYLQLYHYGDTGGVDLLIDNNVANGNYDSNIYAYVNHDASYGEVNIEVTDNECSNSEDENGIEVEAYQYADDDLNILIARNTANFNYDENIEIDDAELDGDGDLNITVTDNEANGSEYNDGIYLDDVYHYGDGDINVMIDGNNADGNDEDNIYLEVSHYGAYGDTNIEITNNNASHSEDYYGIELDLDNDADGDITVLIADNIANGNHYDNIYFEDLIQDGDGDIFVDILRNEVSGAESYENAGNTILVDHNADGDVFMNILDNIANYNYEDNFYVDIDTSSIYNNIYVDVLRNEMNGSENGYGLGLYVDNHSDNGNIEVTVADNSMNYNSGDGMDLEVYMTGNYGDVMIDVMNNEANWNTDNGFDIDTRNYAEGLLSVNVSGNVNNYNNNDGIVIDADHYDEGLATLYVTGNEANHNGSDGIDADLDIWSTGNTYDNMLVVANNTADWNGSNGIEVDMTNYGVGTPTISVYGNGPSWNESDNINIRLNQHSDYYAQINVFNNPDNNYSLYGSGIYVGIYQPGSGETYLSIHGNTADMNYRTGIQVVNTYGFETLYADIYDNQANGNGFAGISVETYNATTYVDIHDNTANGNGFVGIGANTDDGSLFADIHDNTVNNNYIGIGTNTVNGGYANLSIYDNMADANVTGIDLTTANGGATYAYLTDNVITESFGTGVNVQTSYYAYTWLGMYGNEITDSNYYNGYATTGVDLGVHFHSYMNGLMEGNTVTGNYNGASFYQVTGGFDIDLGNGYFAGDNTFINNNYEIVNNTFSTVYAEYNWWGSNADPGARMTGNTVDYTPWLTSAP